MSGSPLTADEREQRTVEYLKSLNKGQLAEFKLNRLGKLSNLRKALRDLITELIEIRAEDLAAGMLMEQAPARPKVLVLNDKPLPLCERKRRKPVWIKREANVCRRKGKVLA